ncbi:Clp protease ClpP, partial [Photobacterium carnosum]|uniref:phage major capsid protein n=1 Tax=Photobacterium carnosum TaxID=2023717 RepID=UPI001E65713F
LQAKAFKHTPDDLLNQLVQPPATPTPEPLINQQSDPMPKPIDNDALQNALKNENQRQSTIRALCATHKVSDTLRDEMLNNLQCSAEDSSLKILQYLGAVSINGQVPNAEQSPTGLTNTHIHVGNGNTTKDTLQNALNARCGTGEIEKDNPYRLKTLLDMAEIAVGKDAKYCGNKNELVARAFNSGDFADIITESVRTVMRDEAQVRAPLWRDLANTENLPNFKETDLILINDAPDLMAVSEDGEYKSATIKGSGEKIQLASFGREIAFTRQAIINDEIALISKIPRKFMQSAYRLSDKLMFNAILSGKMGDGKSVFQAGGANKWGNLVNDIPAADYQALVMALHKAFATATTSEGDALDLRGEILLANPDHASFLEAVLNTASKPDTFNPAYKKFAKVVETARLATINGAIALTGKDFDSVVMGFLDGAQDPWLETGDGWSSDGAKFRITYDVTSKVLDRRGIAQATFANK